MCGTATDAHPFPSVAQIMDVGIAEAKTLNGLIDQVFDKALLEPHFCELYSQLCDDLAKQLPEFDDPEAPETGSKRKLTFRRILLNKCQVGDCSSLACG